MNCLGVASSQTHAMPVITPGSSKMSYISILQSNVTNISDANTMQQFATALSSPTTQCTQSSPVVGHALGDPSPMSPYVALPEAVRVNHVEGATVSISTTETTKANQNLPNTVLDGTEQDCSSSDNLEKLVSKASDVQTVFMKQVNVGGENKTIFVDSEGRQIMLPQGLQVLDLAQPPTIENNSMLSPHNLGPTEAPFYVNAKQYNRILKRREARARLEARGKITKGRSKFLYNSRHAHAAKRVRGPGGKFLKRDKLEKQNTLNDVVVFPETDKTTFQTLTLQYSS